MSCDTVLQDLLYLFLVLGAVAIVFLLRRRGNKFSRTLFYTDAIGLGMFTIGGIEGSFEHGVNLGFSILMGVMSATFGGLIADIISNRVPALLKRGELYATVCAIGGIVYVVLYKFNLDRNLNIFICVVLVVALRILSKRNRLFLPEI
jgi:uncharacterized membrane protein YeiH